VAPRLNPEVIVRRLGDGAVLVHLPSNRIYELNDTAMRVWELLSDGLDLAAIQTRMDDEYEATGRETAPQIAQVVETFRHEGLIA
jgi:hypothetical protein